MTNKTAILLSLLMFLCACTRKPTPSPNLRTEADGKVLQAQQKTNLPFGFDDSTTYLQVWKNLVAKGFHKQSWSNENKLRFACPSNLSFSGVEMENCTVVFYKGHIYQIQFEGATVEEAADEVEKLKALKKYFENEGLKATTDKLGSLTVGRDLMGEILVTFSGNPIDIDIRSGYYKRFVPCILYTNMPVMHQKKLDDDAAQREKDKSTKGLLK